MYLLKNRWLLYTVLTLIWGTSFILIKKSIEVYTPLQVGSLRIVIAGILLLYPGIAALKVLPRKVIFWAVITGCAGNFLPMYLFPIAQTEVSSSVAAILDSLVPVFVLILGFLFFKQENTAKQWIGVLIGFAGAWIIIAQDGLEAGGSSWLYGLLVIIAAVFYALSSLLLKQYLNDVPSLQLSAAIYSLWMWPALIILLFTGFFNEFEGTRPQWIGLGYVALLSTLGTAAAMILFYNLIQCSSAVFASSVTYVIPVVASAWGVLSGEKLGWGHLAGGLFILFSIFLIQGTTLEKKQTADKSK